MEENLTKNAVVTILPDRFYCMGAIRTFKNSEPQDSIGHPSEEELQQAKNFGEQLKKQFSI